jgi:DNA-binding transcriptional regulator YiaG
MCDGLGAELFKFRPLDKDDALPMVRKACAGEMRGRPGGQPGSESVHRTTARWGLNRTAVRWGPRFCSTAPGRIPHSSLQSFPFGPRHRPTRVSLADASRAKELFAAFGRTIVSKASPLTGPEVRFLRKRLGKKAIEFAPMVSLTPEYLSALENNPDPVDPGRDKLVRLIYRELSGDKQLKKVFEKGQDLERWITSIHKSCVGENIFATHLRNNMED